MNLPALSSEGRKYLVKVVQLLAFDLWNPTLLLDGTD